MSRLAQFTGGSQVEFDHVTTLGMTKGMLIEDNSIVTLRSCTLACDSGAVVETFTVGDESQSTVEAWDTTAVATDGFAAWQLGGGGDTLRSCEGNGFVLAGERGALLDCRSTGVFNVGMWVGGRSNQIIGGKIAGQGAVGLLMDEPILGRASSLTIVAGGFAGDVANLALAAVQVSALDEPAVMLDDINVVGRGTGTTYKYACVSTDPCADCLPQDEWPPWDPDDPLWVVCEGDMALWMGSGRIQTTRSVLLPFPTGDGLEVGASSPMWTPNHWDYLPHVTVTVWCDDYPSNVGDTVVKLFDETTGSEWAEVAVPGPEKSATVLVHRELVPDSVYETALAPQFLRAEIVDLTETALSVAITLELP